MATPETVQIFWGLFQAAREVFLSISPAWSRWIAPGRIGFMSTQRRDGRSAPTTEAGRRGTRHGSRLAHCKDLQNRANRLGHANADSLTWDIPASASRQMPAMAAPSTLQQDTRCDISKQQPVRSFWPGSPPVRQAAALETFFDRLIGYPPTPSPAVFALFHPTLPHVSAAFRRRTERYDGKGNLYLQHAP